MNHREEAEITKELKKSYLNGIENLILSRQRELEEKRDAFCKNIFSDPQYYRTEFAKMLGWPLTDRRDSVPPPTKSTKLSDEEGYSIYRMTFKILDGVELSGLYFKMNTDEKKPLVIVQHGGLGTPELIAGMYGSTQNYHQMLPSVIACGAHAFAPQLLLWDAQKYGVTHERAKLDAALKRVGSSITAIELHGLTRILDYFETQDNIGNFGMVGLSYGGFYTLFMTALDTRIKSAISCAFFNTRDKYPWCDWTWFNSAALFDDAEIACLVYPRRLCIEIGTRDELFDAEYGKKSYEKLTRLCKNVGTEWLTFIPFDGVHEFCRDNTPIENLIKDLTL